MKGLHVLDAQRASRAMVGLCCLVSVASCSKGITLVTSPTAVPRRATTPLATSPDKPIWTATTAPSPLPGEPISIQNVGDVQVRVQLDFEELWWAAWSPTKPEFIAIGRRGGVDGVMAYDVDLKSETWFEPEPVDRASVVAGYGLEGGVVVVPEALQGWLDVLDSATGEGISRIISENDLCVGGEHISFPRGGALAVTGHSYGRGEAFTTRISMWDLASARCLGDVMVLNGWLRSLVVSPSRERLTTGMTDVPQGNLEELSIWNFPSLDLVCSLPSSYAVGVGAKDAILVWEPLSARAVILLTEDCSVEAEIQGAAVPFSAHPSAALLVSAGRSGIDVWDLETSIRVSAIAGTSPNVNDVLAFSSDGKYLLATKGAVVGPGPGVITIWGLP